MRDTIPRKQQTSHSAWATPALRPKRAGELVESETRGRMVRTQRADGEAVNRLHREPNKQKRREYPPQQNTKENPPLA